MKHQGQKNPHNLKTEGSTPASSTGRYKMAKEITGMVDFHPEL
jgi:hypothetical protein